jgi:hypothetical protein
LIAMFAWLASCSSFTLLDCFGPSCFDDRC